MILDFTDYFATKIKCLRSNGGCGEKCSFDSLPFRHLNTKKPQKCLLLCRRYYRNRAIRTVSGDAFPHPSPKTLDNGHVQTTKANQTSLT
jgi:hypothetical protein